jgi:hypothetical protein
MIKKALLEFIPSDPEVSVSVQNTLNWESMALRNCYLVFPQGLSRSSYSNDYDTCKFNIESEKGNSILVDYVVIDIKRPWFVLDHGCQWLYGQCTDDKSEEYLKWVVHAKNEMQLIFEKDGFMILKRL